MGLSERVTRMWAMCAFVASLGCDPDSHGPSDGGGSADGGGPSDGGADAGSCAMRVEGSEPFAVTLSGRAEYIDAFVSARPRSYGEHEEQVVAYFPEGRRPGAPVVITHVMRWLPGGVLTAIATLDATNGATFSFGDASFLEQDFAIDGTLIGPGGGARVTSSRYFSMSDIAWIGIARDMMLCPVGDAPEPALSFASMPAVAPASTVRLVSPVALGANPIVGVRAGGVDVPVDFTIERGVLLARARGAFPPGAALSWSIDGTDVIGRPLRLDGAPAEFLFASEPVEDLAFTTEPSAASIAIAGASSTWVEDGRIRFGTSTGRIEEPFSVVIALPSPPAGATALRIDQAFTCWTPTQSRAALVAADGSATEIPLACDPYDTLVTLRAALPAIDGPLWLVFVHEPGLHNPSWAAPTYYLSWTLDALAFE